MGSGTTLALRAAAAAGVLFVVFHAMDECEFEWDRDSSSMICNRKPSVLLDFLVTAGVVLFIGWCISRCMSNDSNEDAEDSAIEPPTRNEWNYIPESAPNSRTVKVMSYNVCSQPKYGIQKRMKAISGFVQLHSPDFICFQEINLTIYTIFQSTRWWNSYHCSMSKEEASESLCFCIVLSKYTLSEIFNVSFGPSMLGRLSLAKIMFGWNQSLYIASGHLKSPCPSLSDPNSQHHKFRTVRKRQAKDALSILDKYPNVIFGGDMNWIESDGVFPLPMGWIDAWNELRGEEKGFTFDTNSNKMLDCPRTVRDRLDRILCNFEGKGFRVDNIDIIGKEAILPCVTYKSNKKFLPVFPSDHYGLLLTVTMH